MGSKLARTCFALLIGLLAAEGALRLFIPLFTDLAPLGALAEEQERWLLSVREVSAAERSPGLDEPSASALENQASQALGRIVHEGRFLHPYVGWGTRRVLSLAAAESKRENTAKTFDVWIVGGSVAAMFGDRKMGALAVLEEELKSLDRSQRRDLRFVNFAAGSYKQPQQIELLAYLLTWLEPPDLVINLDGFNEVALGMQNSLAGTHPLYPSASAWNPIAGQSAGELKSLEAAGELFAARARLQRFGRIVERYGLRRSAVTGFLSFRHMAKLESGFRAAQSAYETVLDHGNDESLRGPVQSDSNQVPSLCVRAWERSSLALAGLLGSFDAAYLHVLQPTLHDPGAKVITEIERRRGKISRPWREGVEGGYPLLREAGMRLHEKGIAFFDGSRVFEGIDEPLYLDNCHFGARGNRLLAEAMLPDLRDLLSP